MGCKKEWMFWKRKAIGDGKKIVLIGRGKWEDVLNFRGDWCLARKEKGWGIKVRKEDSNEDIFFLFLYVASLEGGEKTASKVLVIVPHSGHPSQRHQLGRVFFIPIVSEALVSLLFNQAFSLFSLNVGHYVFNAISRLWPWNNRLVCLVYSFMNDRWIFSPPLFWK